MFALLVAGVIKPVFVMQPLARGVRALYFREQLPHSIPCDGVDYSRKATKWRCPTGECSPASAWIKADRLHPLVPRETLRWKGLYRGRAAVEREFGRLKNEWALAPLRVRRIERVRLHADLTILAKLSCALARARAVPLAA
jgi:transposase